MDGEVDGCIHLPGTGEQPRAQCPWGAWSRHRPWLLCKCLPVTPMLGQRLAGLPNSTRVAAGSGSARHRSLSAASPEQGFLLPAAIFSGALLWLQKLAVWQELPFTLWGLSKVQRRKCQRRGKGAHCAPDLPVPGTMQPVKICFLFIQPSLPAFRPGRIKFPYPTLLSREMRFSPCPVQRSGEEHAPAEGNPPPRHRCRQIRLLPGHDGVPRARLGVVPLGPCSALEVRGQPDVPGWSVLCLSVSGREEYSGAKPALEKALGSL